MTTPKAHVAYLSLVAHARGLPSPLTALLATAERPVRAALAGSAFCPATVRTTLLTDRAAAVRAAALRHCEDPDLLTRAAASRAACEREAAAANPHTPTAALEVLAAQAGAGTARALLTNPALAPEHAMRLARRYRVGQLWAPGRPEGPTQGSHVWRSSGVALTLRAHPQVAAAWVDDPEPTTARVIAYSPTVDAAVAADVLARRRNPAVLRALAANPFLASDVAAQVTTPQAAADRDALEAALGRPADVAAAAHAALATPHGRAALVAVASRTLDWALADHPDLEDDTALALAGRVRAAQTVEPYVLATLTNRFGAPVAGAAKRAQGVARLAAAGAHSPLLRLLADDSLADPVGAEALVATLGAELGDDALAWEVAVAMLRHQGKAVAGPDLATIASGVAAR